MYQRSNDNRSLLAAVALLAMTLFTLLLMAPTEAAPAFEEAATAEWDVIADGLANPRGLVFGPDGALYVAEAGAGGDGACVPDPEGGDRCYGETGAITKVTLDENMNRIGQQQIITGVGSLANETTGAATGGPTAVAFLGTEMFFTTGYGGDPADLLPAGPFGAGGAEFTRIMWAGDDDSYTSWSDLGAFESALNPDEDLPDSNPFDLLAPPPILRDDPTINVLLAVDAGANTLLGISGTGAPNVIAVFPETMVEFPPGSGSMVSMDAVPTSVVIGPDDAYYMSQLTGFPFPVGGASIWRVVPGNDPTIYAGGFTNILDLAFAADGSLYVLEMFTNSLLSGDPTGAITRIDPDHSRTVIAREGLITPTDLVIGPDHALYVTNFGVSPDAGQVVRIPTKLSEANQFTAILGGQHETPPVETDASGVARMSLAADGTLSWEVAVRDIDPITAAHIHAGAPGVAGPPIITLYSGTGDFDQDNPISGQDTLTDEQIEELLAGNYYVNVHTAANPAGEIRGQLYPARTLAFNAMLSGANEVPNNHSDASGEALLTLSADMTELHFRVMVHDIEDVTAAHIHEGPVGVNGGIVFPLYMGGPPPFDEDNPVGDTLTPDLTQVAALLAGDYYVNVHTTAFPPGEIRGQVWAATPRHGHHSLLTGREENPSVTTDAVGVATYALSADLSTLDFHLAVRDIENVTAAHLHTGWHGQNGPIAHPLFMGGPPPLEPGSPVNGLLTLDAQDVLDLWSGYYYTNVHTTDNPGGEIRGQVEGASLFHTTLSGVNEVPPNGSAGTGGAVLALSDDASRLHWRVFVNHLEHITAAHIHLGAPGVNGPVVIPLFAGGPPPFDEDNPVSDSAPVTDENIFDLIAGDYYVNVHTSHLPAGEIRGQVRPIQPEHMHFEAWLDGDQEVPPVDTEATGEGHFLLDGHRNVLHYFVDVQDIDNVTASHIHLGPVGVNGPIVSPLFMGGPPPFDPDNPVGGGVSLGAAELVDLLTEFYYVNVHTTEHPGGEIRGQIAPAPTMVYLSAVLSK